MTDNGSHVVPIQLRGRELDTRLPALFSNLSRSGAEEDDPFLPRGWLQPVSAYDVGATTRSDGGGEALQRRAAANEVVVLELADGGVLVTSAGRLREALEQAQPELVGADGSLQLDLLRGPGGASRDIGQAIGSLVQRVFTVVAGEQRDGIADAAVKYVVDKGGDALLVGVSWLGTEGLMWAIERKIERTIGRDPGNATGQLLRWNGRDALTPPPAAIGGPMLVFVHGTGSSIRGGFGDLAEGDAGLWSTLEGQFSGGIYGFEHRTLSASPIDNALDLLRQLPDGAQVSLVTHSRGGLVGDLLCLDPADASLAAAIEAYRSKLPGTGDADPTEARRVQGELETAHAGHRAKLAELAALLAAKKIRLQRYVRVAAPARGTLLAGGNLDLFLSGLLSLIGQVPWLRGLMFSAFKRVVIEIAKNRTNPHLVPGIEAMLPDSPMARLLRAAPVRAGVEMAVIAGDIEGGGLLKRLGVFLTDTLFFEREDNDLVVDTAAMLGGVATAAKAVLLFDRGAEVSHFRYFTNPRTRDALRYWLLADKAGRSSPFTPLPTADVEPDFVPSASRSLEEDTRPLVVVLPGVMGTHLARGDDRLWLDPLDIAKGGLAAMAFDHQDIAAQALIGPFYGKLCRQLEKTHRVETFPYDWRQPLGVLAERFTAFLQKLADGSGQRPVRLLAHSMGGLVVRAAIHRDTQHNGSRLFDGLMARSGARLVMCGTPHQGAHSMVENLIGKGDTLRALVMLDVTHSMQEILDIVSGFPGPLALLPKPGFVDTFQGQEGGGEFHDYQNPATWQDFRSKVNDFWFGNGRVGQPSIDVLDQASWLWQQDGEGRPRLPDRYSTKAIYVAGVAKNTPCGLTRDARGRLRMVGTTRGDGTVTWASGKIDGIGSFYYMPGTEHGSLLSNAAYFDALIELLHEGRTAKLETAPPVARALEAETPVLYDAGPPTVLDPDAVARLAVGAALSDRVPPPARHRLSVGVKAMDLRFLRNPVMVGHYQDDPIAGPEAIVDGELLDGALRERYELGLYAGPRGSAIAVLRPPAADGTRLGAVVAGLGPYDGSLTPTALTECVRAGALRYLLHASDVIGSGAKIPTLSVLLIGYNSSTNISVAASVEALVRGVIEANARYQQTTRRPGGIGRLDIVELYRDTAITACYALRDLRPRLAEYAQRQSSNLDIRTELESGEGVRQRLFDRGVGNYWPRLLVSGVYPEADDDAVAPPATARPDRMRFLYIGERARAEAVQVQRQAGLLERLVRSQIRVRTWQRDFGRTLFQLTVPHEFKESMRGVRQAVLVVDAATANLPWELMLGDDPVRSGGEALPLSIRMKLVRQFQTGDYRRNVRQSVGRTALVVGHPSVEGFGKAFPPTGGKPPVDPDPLPGAEKEAEAAADLLARMGYEVDRVIGPDQTASNVLTRLYRRPWRVLHISAHGIYRLMHADLKLRSGVVLSDGFLITAAEIKAMEVVPELVFLNCCHLGAMDATPVGRDGNQLAASVARELIDIGVRCVVVAGWAVTDHLAQTFGQTFYDAMFADGMTFGDAAHAARLAVWEQDPEDITWGAFQVYGDPDWRAERPLDGDSAARDAVYASPEEVLDHLARLRVDFTRRAQRFTAPEREAQRGRVHGVMQRRCRPDWRTRAEVQSALGMTWRALNELELAREAFLAGLAASGPDAAAATHDIEQVANIEAKLAEQKKDPAYADLAIARLKALDHLVRMRGGAELGTRSVERQSLLGSAWKVKAAVLARLLQDEPPTKKRRDAMLDALREAADVYREGAGVEAGDRIEPYPALNWLWLEAVLGRLDKAGRAAAAEAAARCAEAVAARESPNIWDQIMVVEAELVRALIDGSYAAPGREGNKAAATVAERYRQQFDNLVLTPGQLGSVTGQLEKTAQLLRTVAQARPKRNPEAERVATRLDALAVQLKKTA